MKKLLLFPLTILIVSSILLSCKNKSSIIKKVGPDEITVAAYYFPNYHLRDKNDPRISYQHLETCKSGKAPF